MSDFLYLRIAFWEKDQFYSYQAYNLAFTMGNMLLSGRQVLILAGEAADECEK